MLRLTKRRDSSWFQAGDKFALSVLWRVRVRVKLEGRETDSLRMVRGGRNCFKSFIFTFTGIGRGTRRTWS